MQHGACLPAGSGVVPDGDLTPQRDDVAHTVSGIGTLTNTILKG
jgi:hypothetical protein